MRKIHLNDQAHDSLGTQQTYPQDGKLFLNENETQLRAQTCKHFTVIGIRKNF